MPDTIRPRLATQRITAAAGVNPVVFVVGPRQVGKSTLLQSLAGAEGRTVISLDDPAIRAQVREDPLRLLEQGPPLVIDEIQREPDLVLALKRAVDRMGTARKLGHFLVTGSANPLTMKSVADGLTGRASYVWLRPLTRRETLGHAAPGAWDTLLHDPVERWGDALTDLALPRGDWREVCRAGGLPWPALHLRDNDARHLWFASYVRNHVDRDVRELSAIENDLQYFELMQLAALRVGNLINQTELGRDARLSQPQVSRWLSLMETTFQAKRIHSYSRSRTTRLIKTPKLYWYDTGLAFHLSRAAQPTGAHFENFVLNDLEAWAEEHPTQAHVTYWRTAGGREVDFVLEGPRDALLGIEVKTSKNVTAQDARHLVEFVTEREPEGARGVVLYDGDTQIRLHGRILAIPWWQVL